MNDGMAAARPRLQCAKCPWKKSTDPKAIPNGYSRAKHAGLADTIADAGSCCGVGGELRIMACHESACGSELPCVGWLVHQLGPGNNIPLRLRVIHGAVDANVEADGPQHERFEDTIPQVQSRTRRRRV